MLTRYRLSARLYSFFNPHPLIKEEKMEELSFYDVKTKSKFKAKEYSVKEKSGRYFAVTKSPKGTHECWRVLSKDQAMKMKK